MEKKSVLVNPNLVITKDSIFGIYRPYMYPSTNSGVPTASIVKFL